MALTFCRRIAASAIGLAIALGFTGAPAPAALDMFAGAQRVVKGQSLDACDAAAKKALFDVLKNAAEIGNLHEWKGMGQADASGNSFVGVAIHCYPLDNAYLVTFTCAAQVPPNPDTASAVCEKVSAAFGESH